MYSNMLVQYIANGTYPEIKAVLCYGRSRYGSLKVIEQRTYYMVINMQKVSS